MHRIHDFGIYCLISLFSFSSASALVELPPEESYMLPSLHQAVKEYRASHGRSPSTWIELGHKAACWPLPKTAEHLPTSSDAKWWRPNACKLFYGFADTEYKEFILLARDGEGRIRAGITGEGKVISITLSEYQF